MLFSYKAWIIVKTCVLFSRVERHGSCATTDKKALAGVIIHLVGYQVTTLQHALHQPKNKFKICATKLPVYTCRKLSNFSVDVVKQHQCGPWKNNQMTIITSNINQMTIISYLYFFDRWGWLLEQTVVWTTDGWRVEVDVLTYWLRVKTK